MVVRALFSHQNLSRATPAGSKLGCGRRIVIESNLRSASTTSNSMRVLVTGAAGQIGSYLSQLTALGRLGADKKIELNMLDVEPAKDMMRGLAMELEDCAYGSLDRVNIFTDAEEAMKGIDCAIFLANKMPLTQDMKRVDLLLANRDLFTELGEMFDKHANPNAIGVVVTNPCNSCCLSLIKSARNRDPRSFTALSRLDHNRLVSAVARQMGVPTNLVTKCIIWGNHSHTMQPDIRFAEYRIDQHPHSFPKKVITENTDPEWAKDELSRFVRNRFTEIIKYRKRSSALSAGNAAADQLRDWINGTPIGDWVSMGVYSDGKSYEIPEGIVYSMPTITFERKYSIVEDLPIDPITKEHMMISAEELMEEKKLMGLD